MTNDKPKSTGRGRARSRPAVQIYVPGALRKRLSQSDTAASPVTEVADCHSNACTEVSTQRTQSSDTDALSLAAENSLVENYGIINNVGSSPEAVDRESYMSSEEPACVLGSQATDNVDNNSVGDEEIKSLEAVTLEACSVESHSSSLPDGEAGNEEQLEVVSPTNEVDDGIKGSRVTEVESSVTDHLPELSDLTPNNAAIEELVISSNEIGKPAASNRKQKSQKPKKVKKSSKLKVSSPGNSSGDGENSTKQVDGIVGVSKTTDAGKTSDTGIPGDVGIAGADEVEDEDNWDAMFDDTGDCLDDNMKKEVGLYACVCIPISKTL